MQAAIDIVTRFRVFIIDPAILIVFALGFFLFVWGLVEFLWKLNEGGENDEGKKHMVWGIAGMLIMISVYGIIALLDNTFGLNALSGNSGPSSVSNVNIPNNFFGSGN